MTGLNLLTSNRNSEAFRPGYAPTDTGDVFAKGFANQRQNFNMDAQGRLEEEPMNERNALLSQRLGKDLYDVTGNKEKYDVYSSDPIHMGGAMVQLQKENNNALDAVIETGRKENPSLYEGIKTTAEIRAEAMGTAQKATEDYEGALQRNPSSISKTVGSVGGGIAGAFTDPINILTLPLGAGETKALGTGAFAFARGLALSALKEGTIQAAIEAASVPKIASWQQQLGHKYGLSDAATDIGFGFLGGAGIRAAAEGIVPALRGVRRGMGNASSIVLDKIADSSARVPQSVRDGLKYMERVAYIDEDIPKPPQNHGDIQEHRQALEKTGSDINSYRRPAAELPIPNAEVSTLTGAAIPKTPAVAPDVFTETAKSILADLQTARSFDVNRPSDVARVIGYTPDSLSQFIRKNGGISDPGGDLAHSGIDHKSLPGLIRKSREETSPGMFGPSTEGKAAQIDYVKERVFDAGYFPEKSNYNDISNDELMSAIRSDVEGKKIYSADDMERIATHQGSSDIVDKYDALGITHDMTPQDVADRLREVQGEQEIPFDTNAYSPREYREPVPETPVEIKPTDRLEASRASFEQVLKEDPNLVVALEDGSTMKLSEYAKRMKEDQNILEAITTCRLG